MQNLFHVCSKPEINGIKKFLWLFFLWRPIKRCGRGGGGCCGSGPSSCFSVCSSSDHGLMKLCFYPFTSSSRKKLLPVRLPTPGPVGQVRLVERGERESVPTDRLCVWSQWVRAVLGGGIGTISVIINNNNSKKKEMNMILVFCWILDVCQGASPCSNIQLWPWWNWARADRLSLTKRALKEIILGDLSMIPSGLWKTKTYCHHFIVRLCFHHEGNTLGGSERLLRRHNRPVLVFLQQFPGTVSSSAVRFMTEDFLE